MGKFLSTHNEKETQWQTHSQNQNDPKSLPEKIDQQLLWTTESKARQQVKIGTVSTQNFSKTKNSSKQIRIFAIFWKNTPKNSTEHGVRGEIRVPVQPLALSLHRAYTYSIPLFMENRLFSSVFDVIDRTQVNKFDIETTTHIESATIMSC